MNVIPFLKGANQMKVSEVLKAAAEHYRSTNYLAKSAEIPQPTLQRFLANHQQLSLPNVDKLAETMGLELVEEVNWREYIDEAWQEYAISFESDAWNEYEADAWQEYKNEAWSEYEAVAWQEALNDDWEEDQFDEWLGTAYAKWAEEAYQEWVAIEYPDWQRQWCDEERPDFEEKERKKLESLPWVRIIDN